MKMARALEQGHRRRALVQGQRRVLCPRWTGTPRRRGELGHLLPRWLPLAATLGFAAALALRGEVGRGGARGTAGIACPMAPCAALAARRIGLRLLDVLAAILQGKIGLQPEAVDALFHRNAFAARAFSRVERVQLVVNAL